MILWAIYLSNKHMELVNFMIDREKEIVRKEEEVYKAIAKYKATKRDIVEFIETMDYTPTPLQYVFIMDAITKMGIEMYDKGIVPSKMSNDAFDIAYEEMLQKTFSRIREHLEDDDIKGDYLIQ